jgi:hypothetical protein
MDGDLGAERDREHESFGDTSKAAREDCAAVARALQARCFNLESDRRPRGWACVLEHVHPPIARPSLLPKSQPVALSETRVTGVEQLLQ